NGTITLQDVSFTINEGELFILVGPSGCGKSTLLNLIAGLEEISEGEIRMDGRVLNDLDPKDRNLAMVFQSYAIYPHMTVRANIAFPLRLGKLARQEIDRRVAEVAAILELTALLDHKPASLSGGQRQRVAMGRAMVREPLAFLLDEPLSNLDARLRVQMRGEIARLQERLGTTMVYVTHDQTEAMTLGDRVAVLNKGKIQQIGTPQELYRQPANLFVAAFVGSPAINFMPAKIMGSRLAIPMGEIELPSPFFSQQSPLETSFVLMGVRPDQIIITEDVNSAPDKFIFETTVERLEWLGSDIYIYFDVKIPHEWGEEMSWPEELCAKIGHNNTLTLIARLRPSVSIRKGDKVRLQINSGDCHYFVPSSGGAL
ncbi:partial sulfate transport system ATP-binding protein, partial [biofilm metagenome]